MDKWRIQPGRSIVEVETRAEEDENEKMGPRLKGYATVYGAYTQIFWGEWRETVAPGAFDESVHRDDIVTLWQHDSTEVLGRKSGRHHAGLVRRRGGGLPGHAAGRGPRTGWRACGAGM